MLHAMYETEYSASTARFFHFEDGNLVKGDTYNTTTGSGDQCCSAICACVNAAVSGIFCQPDRLEILTPIKRRNMCISPR